VEQVSKFIESRMATFEANVSDLFESVKTQGLLLTLIPLVGPAGQARAQKRVKARRQLIGK